MATKNIVPRADGDGSIGTAAKNWLSGFFKSVECSTGITSPTIDTGQGAVECHAMDQPVRTTDAVIFNGVTTNGAATFGVTDAPAFDGETRIWGKAGVGGQIESFSLTLNTGATRTQALLIDGSQRATFNGPVDTQGVLSALGGLSVATSFTSSVNMLPGADNTLSLGSPSFRWSVVYAGTGTINTSDEDYKTAITPLTEAEKAAALEIKDAIGSFQFLDVVAEKGDDARLHVGVGAQTVKAIMEKHGLDPARYGFFCFDEWDEETEERQVKKAVTKTETTTEVVEIDGRYVQRTNTREIQVDEPVFDEFPLYDEDGKQIGTHQVPVTETVVTRKAGSRYGIRYEELAMFILGAL